MSEIFGICIGYMIQIYFTSKILFIKEKWISNIDDYQVSMNKIHIASIIISLESYNIYRMFLAYTNILWSLLSLVKDNICSTPDISASCKTTKFYDYVQSKAIHAWAKILLKMLDLNDLGDILSSIEYNINVCLCPMLLLQKQNFSKHKCTATEAIFISDIFYFQIIQKHLICERYLCSCSVSSISVRSISQYWQQRKYSYIEFKIKF